MTCDRLFLFSIDQFCVTINILLTGYINSATIQLSKQVLRVTLGADMFGENFGLDYYRQRHAELVQRAERVQLIRCLEAMRRAEQGRLHRTALHRRVLAAAGGQLVRLGNHLQGTGAGELQRPV